MWDEIWKEIIHVLSEVDKQLKLFTIMKKVNFLYLFFSFFSALLLHFILLILFFNKITI